MSEEEIFTCNECDKLFTTKFSLNRHQYIHSNVKNFSCRFCPKKFALKQYLKEHECIHTDSKPFVCGVGGCQIRFRQRGKLSLHRRKHRGYKMKEYRLGNQSRSQIGEFSEFSDDVRQMTQNYNEESKIEVSRERRIKKKGTKRNKKNFDDIDSDSDYELNIIKASSKIRPTECNRTLRKRKESSQVPKYIQSSSISLDEDSVLEQEKNLEKDGEMLHPDVNVESNVVTNKNNTRKCSNDSTHDIYHCGLFPMRENHGVFDLNHSKIENHQLSNFGILLDAFKICQNLKSTLLNNEIENLHLEEGKAEKNEKEENRNSLTFTPPPLNTIFGLISGNDTNQPKCDDLNSNIDAIKALDKKSA